jgi:ATP/maltotriose-dependent transcriptional regulator MalT
VHPTELMEAGETAIRTFEDVDDNLGLARAWRLVAQAHYLARHAGPSAEASERALVHARRAADRLEQQETVQWLSVALFLGPKSAAEAVRRCTRLLDESGGDPTLEIYVLGSLAYLVAIQGQIVEAEQLLDRARRMMHELGEGWHFPVFAALLALWERDPAAAEREVRPGYEILKQVGERAHFCTVASLLGRIAYAEGRYDEADAFTRECEAASRPNDVECQIHWRGTRAKVLAQRGDHDAAEALARDAVAFAEESDFLSSHGDALVDLAEVLRIADRPTESACAMEGALRLFEQKGDLVSATRTRTKLAHLATRA